MILKDDLELIMLSGKKIDVGIGYLYPLTIGDITEIGYSKYNQYLNTIAFTLDDIRKVYDLKEDATIFTFIVFYCLTDEDYKNTLLKTLSLFFKEEVKFYTSDDEYGYFYLGNIEDNRKINELNFEYIQYLIKRMNNITKEDYEEENPSDARAKEILEKRKKARDLVAKAKSKDSDDGEPLTFADLVSILASNGNGVTPFNVWDMNIYLFNNQFNRMKMLDDYDVNIRSLLAGADPKKIELKHWMSKIK